MTIRAPYEAFFKLDTGTHTDDIRQLAVTPDGQLLVSAGECTIRVWDLKTRQLLRRLLGPVSDRAQERYGNGNVERFAISPDSRWLVALKRWSEQAGASDGGDVTRIEVFELATGNLEAGFRYPGRLLDIAFSPDGRQLAMAGNACDGKLRRAVVLACAARAVLHGGFAEAPRGVVVQAFTEAARKDELAVALRFVPGASGTKAPCRLVAAAQGSRGKTGTLAWYTLSPTQGLRRQRVLVTDDPIDPGTLAVSHALVVVADARRRPSPRATPRTTGHGCLRVHDHDGCLMSKDTTEAPPASAAFSASGAQLLVGMDMGDGPSVLGPVVGDHTVQVNAYDVFGDRLALRSSYYGHDGRVGALAWLADGSAVSAGGDNQAVHFWSPRHRVGEATAAIRGVGQTCYQPGIDADENVLFGVLPQRRLPPNHAQRQQRFDLRELSLATTCPSEPGEYDFESDKWSILALEPAQTIPLRCNRGPMDMGAPPDLTLFVGSDDEWVIWTRSGYHDRSPAGARRIGYHVNRGDDKEALFFPADRFNDGYRPDIVKAVVQHGSEDGARAAGMVIAPIDVASQLPPIVEFARGGVVAGPEQVSLAFSIETLCPAQPVTRVWILRNERFVWSNAKPSPKACANYKVTLRLAPGRNVFSLHAETATAKAVPLTIELQGAATAEAAPVDASASGRLFLLSVGVSDFAVAGTDEAGEFQRLKFAHQDAIAVYNAFAQSRRSNRLDTARPLRNDAFDAVEARLLLDAQATKAAILRELDRLCARIVQRSRAAGAERDVLMVFLSGHGVRFKGEPDLYFWNHDLRPSAMESTGLSMLELGERITSVPAEVVLVIDACHAGMAGGNLMSGLDAEELAQRIHAVNERGMYILNAARSEEKAREDVAGGQGVFTRAMLDALASERFLVADAPGRARRSIGMLGLIAGIQELLPRITERARTRAQTPVCRMYGDLLPLTIYRR